MKKFIKENWFKVIISFSFLVAAFSYFFLSSAIVVDARSGCCSWHDGVCGCQCCDGTPLSATCAPYYPSCSSQTNNIDWDKIRNNLNLGNEIANKFKGKFLLQVEDKGQIWWINPDDNKRYEFNIKTFFKLMSEHSTGITNSDLNKIPVGK